MDTIGGNKMKKLLALMLAAALTLSLTACGGKDKKAFEASQEAYNNVNAAYEIIENFGSDIYEAWRLGIYHGDEDDFDLAYLADELALTEDELQTGLAYLINGDEWDSMSDDEKQGKIAFAGRYFPVLLKSSDNVFSVCVYIVTAAYQANGKIAETKEYLDTAKMQMRDLSENYSDYEHYPALKGYYTTTNSFFDFCQTPTGSFEQLTTTIEDYETTARDYKADLDYIFED